MMQNAKAFRFISLLANWINTTPTNRAFTDLYNTQTGDFADGPFIARPVAGGHFALLALNNAPISYFEESRAETAVKRVRRVILDEAR